MTTTVDLKAEAVEKVDEKQIEEVMCAIGTVDFIDDGQFSDNVSIILASAYERCNDCPEDQVQDDGTGWKPWALEQENALRRRMAIAAITAYEKLLARRSLVIVPREPTDEQIVAMTVAEPCAYFPLKRCAENRRKQYRAAIEQVDKAMISAV